MLWLGYLERQALQRRRDRKSSSRKYRWRPHSIRRKSEWIPKGFGLRAFQQTIVWDYIKIGDASYALPVTLDFYLDLFGDPWHVSFEYKNHRRFEAGTSITFK